MEDKKRHLNSLEVIELLGLLKTHSQQEIADHFDISHQGVSYYKDRYDATTPLKIDRAIIQLQKDSNEYAGVDYSKQSLCIPKTFYFKCHNCGFVASELNISGIIEHMERYEKKEIKLLTQQTI